MCLIKKKYVQKIWENNFASQLQHIAQVRPDWHREDLILQQFTEGFSNLIFGGHVGDKSEMILVKVYGTEGGDKVSRRRKLGQDLLHDIKPC